LEIKKMALTGISSIYMEQKQNDFDRKRFNINVHGSFCGNMLWKDLKGY
jgi:hypothetical protein